MFVSLVDIVEAVWMVALVHAGAAGIETVRTWSLVGLGPVSDSSPLPPKRLRDLSNVTIGQRRHDAARSRQLALTVLGAVVVAQLLPIAGLAAGLLVLFILVAVDAAQRAWDRVETALIIDDPTDSSMSLIAELRVLGRIACTPASSNPFRGRATALGVVAGSVSLTLAVAGWMGVAGFFGVEWRLSSPVDELVARGSATVAVVGALLVMAARLPIDGARRVALRRPREGDAEIVYLRSFGDDRLTVQAGETSRGLVDRLTLRRRQGYERLLVSAVQNLAPVVTVGNPDERVPPLGAYRMYLEHEGWEPVVRSMVQRATLVIVSVGETPSLGTEIAMLRDLDLLDRVVFVLPPVDRDSRQRRIALLVETLNLQPDLVVAACEEPAVIGIRFSAGVSILMVSSGYTYATYEAAVFEAAADRFEA